MAAICGVLQLRGRQGAAALVQTISAGMPERSSDGFTLWDGGYVALAFGTRSTTPEDQFGRQPVPLPDGGRLVVEGRIDNREELAQRLGFPLRDLASSDDSRLFACAWVRWGEDLWRHVLGDYALASWCPNARRLRLVRDRIGVRSLYFVETAGLFAFASEVEALLPLPGVSRAPNEYRIADFLVPGFAGGLRAGTWYRDVARVEAAEAVSIDLDTTRSNRRRYWHPTPLPALRFNSLGEATEAFRACMSEAVRCRMRTSGATGLLLSGGVDSATVAAGSTDFRPIPATSPLAAVSVQLDGPLRTDEGANIERMRGNFAEQCIIGYPSMSGPVAANELDELFWARPHPVDASMPLVRLCYLGAARSGIRVMLDGIDGDQLMASSYAYLFRTALGGALIRAFQESRAASRHHTNLWGPWWRTVALSARAWAGEAAPGKVREWIRADRRADPRRWAGLTPDFARRAQAMELEALREIAESDPLEEELLRPGLGLGAQAFARAGGQFGVEPRHPWLDMRVVEFCRQLGEDFKVRQGWTKFLARESCRGSLASEVVWHRGKEHHGWQILCGMQAQSSSMRHAYISGLPLLRQYRTDVEPDVIDSLDCTGRPNLPILRDATLSGWLAGCSLSSFSQTRDCQT